MTTALRIFPVSMKLCLGYSNEFNFDILLVYNLLIQSSNYVLSNY